MTLKISSSPEAAAPKTKRKPRLWVYGPRLVAVVVALAVGWYTVQTFHELLSGPPPARETADDEALTPEAVLGSAEGPWTFAGQPWRMRVVACPEAELDARLNRPPTDLPTAGDTRLFGSIVHRFADRREVRDGWTVYESRNGGWRATAFGRGDGDGERFAAVRVAFPLTPTPLPPGERGRGEGERGGWKLVEVVPAPADSAASSTTASLLPLPAGSSRAAVRCDDAGRVLGELVSTPVSIDKVRDYCQAKGWKTGGNGPLLWFRKGDETVQAWAASTPLTPTPLPPGERGEGAGGTVLFLTRGGSGHPVP